MMNRIEHKGSKWKFPFVEYVCDNKEEKLPLIIQLHGAGERGNGEDDLKLVDVWGFSNILNDVSVGCRIIMPQCTKDTFWVAKLESLIKFIEQIIKEYNVDETRIYLTGFSMGGYGTWYTAMARPDLFAAIAPVSGGGMAWNAEVLNMPVWAFHGSDDDVVSVLQSEEMVESMKKSGRNIKFSNLEGRGHNIGKEVFNEELLNWLLSNTKEIQEA